MDSENTWQYVFIAEAMVLCNSVAKSDRSSAPKNIHEVTDNKPALLCIKGDKWALK